MKSWLWRLGSGAGVLLLGVALASGADDAGEEEALQAARDAKKEIQEKLHAELTTDESDHFLIHTTAPTAVRKRALKDAEAIYKDLARIFEMKKGEKPWRGRYVILLFHDPADYTNYLSMRKLREGASATSIGLGKKSIGYVTTSKRGKAADQRFHLHFFLPGRFIQAYRGGRKLPSWLYIGFCDYCSLLLPEDKKGRAKKREYVREWMEMRGRTFGTLRRQTSWPPGDFGRKQCMSIVDFMLRQKKFRKFVEKLKEKEVTEEQAFQEVFGVTPAEFEQHWRAFVTKSY